jgi:predicted Zn-dependent protease
MTIEEATIAELGAVSGDTTLAEMQGMTAELGEAIARLAEEEIEAGHLANARTILEGLVVTNHRDADAWALLSVAHRRLSQPLAARFCAEVASRLAPGDPWVRLTRAESLLGLPAQRGEARSELAALAPDCTVGARAQSLLTALGG